MGNIDLLVCGNSDPGTSGVFSPFGKIDGLYFNNSDEPDDFTFEFRDDVQKLLENDDVEYIRIQARDKKEYYKILNELAAFNQESIKIEGDTREKMTIIIQREEDETSTDSDEE